MKFLCTVLVESLSDNDKRTDLPHRPLMKEYLEKHSFQHKYFLCLKKCDSCEFCAPPRMERELFQSLRFIPVPEMDDSGEHYKAFEVSFI